MKTLTTGYWLSEFFLKKQRIVFKQRKSTQNYI